MRERGTEATARRRSLASGDRRRTLSRESAGTDGGSVDGRRFGSRTARRWRVVRGGILGAQRAARPRAGRAVGATGSVSGQCNRLWLRRTSGARVFGLEEGRPHGEDALGRSWSRRRPNAVPPGVVRTGNGATTPVASFDFTGACKRARHRGVERTSGRSTRERRAWELGVSWVLVTTGRLQRSWKSISCPPAFPSGSALEGTSCSS